jgi:DNA-binding MarR family transcriptional regulator/GNAT superfamily N-acetyltransferase
MRRMKHVDTVRRFNRFYTGRIGVLPEQYLGSGYSLAEARVVYEVGRRRQCTATELGRELAFDLGYLSRLLQGLKRRGVLHGKPSPEDGRRSVLTLTPKGEKSYLSLDARSRKEIGGMLSEISTEEQARLVNAMQTVESLLSSGKDPSKEKKSETNRKSASSQISLRPHRPGDMGWVVQSHGRLYFEEYGWDERFEALVAGIAKDFVQKLDRTRERCWIAEMDGEPVGSVFLVKNAKTTAKLRLLLIDPKARGRGLGKRLVGECIAFARAKGYRKLVLWTQSTLAAARHIYRSAGCHVVKRERHREFGYDLTGEYWELKL